MTKRNEEVISEVLKKSDANGREQHQLLAQSRRNWGVGTNYSSPVNRSENLKKFPVLSKFKKMLLFKNEQ